MHSVLAISQSDPRPMYLQIMEQIRRRIALGDWQAGQEIPSIRALAIVLKVSVITVKRAYLELEREGVISTRQGRGSFVSDTVDLSGTLRRQDLDRQLSAAAAAAHEIGLSYDDLESSLRAAFDERGQRKP
jgi:GntR family transcriptional regulator